MAQRAENEFVGCHCGNMDQLISAQGRAGHAMLIDCRSLELTPVALPDDLAIIVIDSKVQRGLVDSHYNLRRQQCEAEEERPAPCGTLPASATSAPGRRRPVCCHTHHMALT